MTGAHDPTDRTESRREGGISDGRYESGIDDDRTDGIDDRRRTIGLDRRRLLQTLGAGTAVAALGSTPVTAASDRDERPPDETKETDEPADGIDPLFGFSAPSAEVSPPVEPDHVVDAEIRERPDREIPEFYFEPTGLFVEPGDTVQFRLVTPHHSVTAYHPSFGTQQRVPDAVPPFSSPVLPVDAYWLYTFDRPGVYDLHCGPHEIFGHVVRLVVGEATGPGAEPVPAPETMPEPEPDAGPDDDSGPADDVAEQTGQDDPAAESPESPPGGPPELRPPVGAAVTVLNDPALEPDRIVDRRRVSWEEIDESSTQVVL